MPSETTTDPLSRLPHQQIGDSATELADCLAQAILSGHWQSGEAFPREMDLCSHFDISRNRVRNALGELSAVGLIDRTAGRGSIIRNISDWHLLAPQMSRWMAGLNTPHPRLIHEVFAFRLAAEPYISELAATHASGDDLSRIEKAFHGMRETAGQQDQRLSHSEYDVAFHDAIYRASHSLIWRQMGMLLRPAIMALIQRSHDHAVDLAESLDHHRQLLDAIRLRQPSHAREATQQLLQRTARDLALEQVAEDSLPSPQALDNTRAVDIKDHR
ncbi:FadR/GntR family transcriptional regulator [Halomonas huangheensis]|uniref:HTH gntR-type domain-containing protein n=1 Tax=Halomonas huangheensis TaxID=1178482 RepID=W1N2E3_9GAMM|nr:FCD domain-containing protein [Halomonas huangheensis]ERL49659.1 hypothetical protein BJB45_00645 [Halomonas huangheensis]